MTIIQDFNVKIVSIDVVIARLNYVFFSLLPMRWLVGPPTHTTSVRYGGINNVILCVIGFQQRLSASLGTGSKQTPVYAKERHDTKFMKL